MGYGGYNFYKERGSVMKKVLIIFGILFVLLGIVAIIVFALFSSVYNGAVTKQNDTLAGWSEVKNQYQRRADLVPNLVETVKGYASHEKEVFEAVTEARAKVGQIKLDPSNMTPEQLAEYQAAQGELTQSLSRLLLVVENYPDLKASENFLALQSQLEGTENRIAVARGRFIESAKLYKNHLESFPNNSILGIVANGKFKVIPFFTAESGADQAPEVKF